MKVQGAGMDIAPANLLTEGHRKNRSSFQTEKKGNKEVKTLKRSGGAEKGIPKGIARRQTDGKAREKREEDEERKTRKANRLGALRTFGNWDVSQFGWSGGKGGMD